MAGSSPLDSPTQADAQAGAAGAAQTVVQDVEAQTGSDADVALCVGSAGECAGGADMGISQDKIDINSLPSVPTPETARPRYPEIAQDRPSRPISGDLAAAPRHLGLAPSISRPRHIVMKKT